MQEFRFHGRGGQGVVVLGKLVARLFFQRGSHVKEFPKFGVERRGAPVEEYVRVDDRVIDLSCQVYAPDMVVVMTDALLDAVDVTAGLAPGSTILLNTSRPAAAFADRLAGYRVATVDANAIALEHGLGTALAPIANTSLFGAFAAIVDADTAAADAAITAVIARPGANIAAARAARAAVSAAEQLPGDARARRARPLPYATFDALPDHAYSTFDARTNRTGSWRSQRPEYAFKIAPCNDRCPAGNDVRGFVEALAAGNPSRALRILLETSPLPAVCGRVCPHPCQDRCNRDEMDGAVQIRALERDAAEHGGAIHIAAAPDTGRSVAIIGAGPAGLSAAWQLRRLGHQVVVFEDAPEPGGMLALGIPDYRLPREDLARDIARIVDLGVDLRLGQPVCDREAFDALRAQHDAVVVAVGQTKPATLAIDGASLPGVEQGLSFLRTYTLGMRPRVGDKVVVVGGGNTALDVAGVALRMSPARDVTILYRRGRAHMPAIADEIEHTLAEGATLRELVSPVAVVAGVDGRIHHLVCERMQLGEPDASGRPRPVPVPDSRHEIACDHLILALGQRTDLAFAPDLSPAADGVATQMDGVFLCGDAADGAGTVTAAIGAGRRAAFAVHRSLGGAIAAPPAAWAPRTDEVVRFDRINPSYFAVCPPATQPRLDVATRLDGNAEVLGPIPDGQAEAGRCLSCGTCNACDNCYAFCPEPAVSRADGVYHFDLAYCKGCGICFAECPRGVIDMKEDA